MKRKSGGGCFLNAGEVMSDKLDKIMIKGWGFHWVGETLIFGNNFSNFGIQSLFF